MLDQQHSLFAIIVVPIPYCTLPLHSLHDDSI